MTEAERWNRAEQLYHEALDWSEGDRKAFLESACAGDEALRREVESLLGHDGQVEGFMSQPAVEVAAGQLAQDPTSSRPRTMSLRSGTRLGVYEILSPVGAGGMGEVYRAHDARLDREVAVKVLPGEVSSPERMKRFEREARTAGALNHPNVLTVYDVGSHNGAPYLVTELLDGQTLRERLHGNRLAPREAVNIAIQIARGLSAMHDKGIVHRDLKPENVFLIRDGRAKILDFGLAHVVEPQGIERDAETQTSPERLTASGMLMGTIAYMSPEQARGQAADARSDVFALGTVLYEMLAGRRPFEGATASDTLSAILREDPAPIDTGARGLPPSLDRVVRRCLEKEPAERFQASRDVAFALEALTQDSDATAPATTAWGARPDAREPQRWSGSRVLLAGAALLTMGATALGTRWLLTPAAVPRIVGYRPLTGGSFGPIIGWATDGERAYFSVGGEPQPRQVSLAGGASAPLNVPLDRPEISDFSQKRSSLLVRGEPAAKVSMDDPLWSVPVPAGGIRKLGLTASEAAWSPDGERLAFLTYMPKAQLGVAQGDGSAPSILFAPAPPDHLTWVTWSPDGRRLRFGLEEAGTLEQWILEIPAAGGTARRLFPGGRGRWSPDGRAFVFTRAPGSWSGGPGPPPGDLFAELQPPAGRPWARPQLRQLTFGPLRFGSPLFTPAGRLLAKGIDRHGQLMRYDAKTSRFEPLLGGLPGGFTDYSWDGRWVAWVDIHDMSLWRSRSDGSEPLQLTTPPFTVGLVRWSPDGRRLVFVGKPSDSPPRIFVIPSDGGAADPVSPPERGGVWDPYWLPDGKTVIWGNGGGPGIRAFYLETRTLSVLPNTDELWFPRCSRQGLVLAGSGPPSSDSWKPWTFWTYDPATGRREDLGVPWFAYPSFTRDGQSVIGYSGADNTIRGFSLRERRVRKVADLGPIQPAAPVFYHGWVGLDPQDAPVILRDTSTFELYALDWEQP